METEGGESEQLWCESERSSVCQLPLSHPTKFVHVKKLDFLIEFSVQLDFLKSFKVLLNEHMKKQQKNHVKPY